MKSLNKSGSKMEVNFHKLEETQKAMFETLILENDIKFIRDKTDGQYTALLKIDKYAISSNFAKTTQIADGASQSPRLTPKINYRSHNNFKDPKVSKRSFSPFKDEKHPVRSFKTKSQLEIESSRQNARVGHSSREIKMKDGKVVNESRSGVLQNYATCFPNLGMEKVLYTPVNIAHVFLMQKIEAFYNYLFDNIQRQKSIEIVSLNKAICEFYEHEYPESVSYYQQSLVNLVYSGHKQLEKPEVAIFMSFLKEKQGSLKLLFYLYVRQIFKIITGNFFLTNKLSECDPIKIQLKKSQISEIVEQAFYFDKELKSNICEELGEMMGGRKQLSYYELMEFFFDLEITYEVCL